MKLEEVNGRFIIKLSNYGYLMFEPLAKTNDNQRYSITFKINDAMVVTHRMMSSGVDTKKMFEYEIINAIDSMKQTLDNIQNHAEIEFLKSCSYEKKNEMMNQLNDKIKKLKSKNDEIRASVHNSD